MQNLSRRNFLETGLKTAITSVIFSVLPSSIILGSQNPKNKWLLGMQGAKTMDCTLGRELEILSLLDYDGLELRDWKLNAFLREWSIDELLKRLDQTGLKPFNISAIELASLGHCSERDEMNKQHEWYFETASKLNCPSAMFVHFTSIPKDMSHKKMMQLAVEDMKYMSDLAGKYNVKVIYEFLGSKTLPIHNIEDTMEILDLTNRENVGWILDFYQFQVTDRCIESLKKCNIKTLSIVHLCDAKDLAYEKLAVPNSERCLPGDGICDNKKLLSTLAEMGYEGPFVIELYNSEFMKMPAEKFAALAKEKSETILKKYFNRPA